MKVGFSASDRLWILFGLLPEGRDRSHVTWPQPMPSDTPSRTTIDEIEEDFGSIRERSSLQNCSLVMGCPPREMLRLCFKSPQLSATVV